MEPTIPQEETQKQKWMLKSHATSHHGERYEMHFT